MANGNNFTSGGHQRDHGRSERDHYGQSGRERDASDNGYYGRNGEYYDLSNEYGGRNESSMSSAWRREEENRGMRNEPNAPRYGRSGGFDAGERDRERGYGDYRSSYGDDNRSFSYRDRGMPNRDFSSRGDYGRDNSRYADRFRDDDRYRREDYRGGERGFWDRASDEVASWFGDEDAERRRVQDQFRGKGPRNYQRSDTRILEDVNDRLSDDPMLDASDIEVAVSKSEVTMTGTVSSRFDKRRAEDLAERVSGVSHVQNNLRVKAAASMQTSTTGDKTGATGTSASQDVDQNTRRLM